MSRSPDLSHHRAYRSVHGGSLVFTYLPVIARHGDIAKTGYFFVGEDSVQHERRPPYALSAVRQFVHLPFGDVVLAYHPVSRPDSLPLLPIDGADFPTEPFIRALEHLLHVRQLEVVHPALHESFQDERTVFVAHRFPSAQNLPQAVLHLRQRFRVYLETAFSVLAVEAVAKVFHVADVRHMRFSPIHFQEEFPFDVLGDAFQGSLGASPALAENHAVVSIADEFVPAPLQFLVELVQHDVAQEGAQRSSLRHALFALLEYASADDSDVQVFVDERDKSAVFHGSEEDFDEFALADVVKEFLQVHVNNVDIAVIGVCLALPQGVMGSALRTESEAAFRELRLVDGHEDLGDGLLYHAVNDGRDSQLAEFSLFFFGDFYPADGVRLMIPTHDGPLGVRL